MNKNILNEINVMKYLFGYQRGVVISEQKNLLTESVVDQIIKKMEDSVCVFLNPSEAGFRDAVKMILGSGTGILIDRKLKSKPLCGDYKSIADIWNKLFVENATLNRADMDKLGQKVISHLKTLATIEGGTPGKKITKLTWIDRPVSGAQPAAPAVETRKNIADKEGWDKIVKHYNQTPEIYEISDDPILVYKKIQITDNGKEYILLNNGDVRSIKTNRGVGTWSWENDKPVLTSDYKVTNPATGYVSGEPESSCEDEFCTNKKVAGRGATGKCVREIQYYLLNSGLVDGIQLTKDSDACKSDSSDCDGIYGTETEKAVRKFQKENNISVDGIVGCETWGYL